MPIAVLSSLPPPLHPTRRTPGQVSIYSRLVRAERLRRRVNVRVVVSMIDGRGAVIVVVVVEVHGIGRHAVVVVEVEGGCDGSGGGGDRNALVGAGVEVPKPSAMVFDCLAVRDGAWTAGGGGTIVTLTMLKHTYVGISIEILAKDRGRLQRGYMKRGLAP